MCNDTISLYMEDGEVLAVHFEDPVEYPYIIIKDESGKAIDGSWTVYSPLMDIHEEVIDLDGLYNYIGQTMATNQPIVKYRNAGEMGLDWFRASLRDLQNQAEIWVVRNKEGQ